MKKNHFKGLYSKYNTEEETKTEPVKNQAKRTGRKNRFTGMYAKYNNDEPGTPETTVDQQRELNNKEMRQSTERAATAIANLINHKKPESSGLSRAAKELAEANDHMYEEMEYRNERRQRYLPKNRR